MSKRILATMVAALLTLALSGPAGAAEAVDGTGQVRGKDLVSRTLTVQDTVYRVTPDTVFLDATGGRLSFEQFPVARRHLGGWVLDGETMVRFEARVSRSGAELRRVQALGEVPH